MRIAFRSIKEQVHDACSRYMRALGCDIREDDAGCDRVGGPCTGEGEKVLFAKVWEAEQP